MAAGMNLIDAVYLEIPTVFQGYQVSIDRLDSLPPGKQRRDERKGMIMSARSPRDEFFVPLKGQQNLPAWGR